MKLAEALSSRAEAVKRLASLRARIRANAKYQEGEEPQEDAVALLKESDTVLDSLENLTKRINLTNTTAKLASGDTITAAMARRDMLRLKASLLVEAADAASGTTANQWQRQTRSELRNLSALDVREIRKSADDVAAELRLLDLAIQEANWQFDLVD